MSETVRLSDGTLVDHYPNHAILLRRDTQCILISPQMRGEFFRAIDAREINEINRPAEDEDLLEFLELPERPYSCLKRANVNTIGDLVRMTEAEVISIPNMGNLALEALGRAMKKNNLNYAEEKK